MLVLTRKQGEKIRIGKDVTITLIRMKGKAVRLGIEAPHHLSVLRGELCDRETLGRLETDAPLPQAPASAEALAAKTAEKPGAPAHAMTSEAKTKAKTKTSARPEQAVACDAWPPQESKPVRCSVGTPTVASGDTTVHSSNGPLRAMVERRIRATKHR